MKDYTTSRNNYKLNTMEVIEGIETMEDKFRNEEMSIGSYSYDNELEYKLINDELIVLSDMAYWRIKYLPDWDSFALYHGNSVPKDLIPENYIDADYHFQKDAKLSKSIMRHLIYIRQHDNYRYRVIANVEQMPRKTKKQKAKYLAVKSKEKAYTKALASQLLSAVSLINSVKIAG